MKALRIWLDVLRTPEWGLAVAILIVLGAIYRLDTTGAFFSTYTLSTLLHNTALFGVLAVGVAVVIVAGGIDLSIGSVVALSSVVLGRLMTSWLPGITEAGYQTTMILVALAIGLSLWAGLYLGWGRGKFGLLIGAAPAVLFALGLLPAFFLTMSGDEPQGGRLAEAALLILIGALTLLVSIALGLNRWVTGAFTTTMLVLLGLGLAAEPGSASALPLAVIAASIALTLLLGLVIGVGHSIMINDFRLPPFIATLATMAGLRSLATILSENRTITVPDPTFRALGSDTWYTLPIFLVIAAIVSVTMGMSILGRHLYALGGNEAAARLSGLHTRRLKTVAYATSALLASLGGILFTGNTGQADSRMGMTYELFAITAAVVGGCSLSGGVGSIRGTVLGLVLIQIVIRGTGLVVQGIDPSQIQGLVLGIVVVLAVGFNQRFRLRQ